MTQATNEPAASFSEWCLVELFGHNRIIGKCTETTIAGGAFLRVDVPEVKSEKAFTRFYRPEAIYCISPISEAIALKLVEEYRAEPVSRFTLQALAEVNQNEPQMEFDGCNDGEKGAPE